MDPCVFAQGYTDEMVADAVAFMEPNAGPLFGDRDMNKQQRAQAQVCCIDPVRLMK